MVRVHFGIGLKKHVLDSLKKGDRFAYLNRQTIYIRGEPVVVEFEIGLFRLKYKRKRKN